jgi:acetyl-CoA carboxylase biotin carboxyl carrier protein
MEQQNNRRRTSESPLRAEMFHMEHQNCNASGRKTDCNFKNQKVGKKLMLGEKYIDEAFDKMTETLAENNLTKIELEYNGLKILMERSAPQIQAGITAQPAQYQYTTEARMTEKPRGEIVKAPIIGTFYESSAPGKPPFVKVGDTVKKGDVLFIIESMKLMNEVNSEFDGVITEIFVKNGSAVEYDEPVMSIR